MPVAIDFETYLISNEQPNPKPVCLSEYSYGKTPELHVGMLQMECALRRILQEDQIVAHNAMFELLVTYTHFPNLRKLLWKSLEEGRWFCTQLYQQLLDNVSKKQLFNHQLANLVKVYFEEDISEDKKNPDAWRLRYNELDGVPLEEWPQEAIDYAIDDSIWALKIQTAQLKIDDLKYQDQLYDGFCLNLMASSGIMIDKDRVLQLEKECWEKIIPSYKLLNQHGFIKLRNKFKANGEPYASPIDAFKRDKMELKEIIKKQAVILDDWMEQKERYAVGKFLKEIHKYIEKTFKDVIRTEKKVVSTTSEALANYIGQQPDNEVIKALDKVGDYEKALTAFVTRLKQADPVIRSTYNPIVSSGRTSARASAAYPSINIQQCFDKETEILTQEGWKFFKDLRKTDTVAQYNKNTQDISFVKPTRHIEYTSDEIYYLKTEQEQINLAVTEDHRLLTLDWKNSPVISNVYNYSSSSKKQLNAGILQKRKELTKSELHWIFAVQADAHLSEYGLDFSFNKQRKIDKFKKYIKANEGNSKSKKARFFVHYNDVPFIVWEYVDRKTKLFKPSIIELAREDILEYLMFWDGDWTRKAEWKSKHKINCDLVQALLSCSNIRARLATHKVDGKTYHVVRCSRRNFSRTANCEIVKQEYNDKVYCVEVPSQYIVTRRENTVAITGNCPRGLEGVTWDIRNCFVPREGFLICSIDYNGLELSSAAHQLYKVRAGSAMRRTINSGKEPVDMHSKLACRIKSMKEKKKCTYEEFVANKKKPGYKEFRQLSKPINLGFPGGIGYDTMRELLAKEGIYPKFKIIQKSKWEEDIDESVKRFRLEGYPVRKKQLGRFEFALVYDELVELKNELFSLYPDLKKFLTKKHEEFLTGETRAKKNNFGMWESDDMYAFNVLGVRRDWCTYTALCNGFLMQTPSAIGAKLAVRNTVKKYLDDDDINVLGFIHDEILFEVRDNERKYEIIQTVSEIMVDSMQEVLSSVRIAVEADLMPYWCKEGGKWTKTYWKDPEDKRLKCQED